MAKQTYVNKSMVEIAEEILKSEGKKNIYDLLESVASLKDISKEDTEKLTQLYIDMTLSAKFVFCGNDEWDLKENNLELWDKDGSYFNTADDVIEEEEDDTLTVDDYYIPEEDELELKDDEEDEEEEDGILPDEEEDILLLDEEDAIVIEEEEDIDFDDDDYNEIMDDYEDMYDK
jgi:DNA-directed RNA polymerase subunit delta